MHRYKVGEVVQVLDIERSRSLHCSIPCTYPAPYTMGVVKDTDDTRYMHLCINYHCSGDFIDTWWHLGDCVRYISHRELQAMVRYYALYRKSKWLSVRDFYDKVSTTKKIAEDAIKYKKELYKGGDYRILCGNAQYFTAAFMMPSNLLYVKTSVRDYVIDVEFIKNYLESNKNESRL
nr:MAG TPA: hypothetical protein [Caudoviricetes sp.]